MINWHALVVALTLLTRLPLPAHWRPPQFTPELQSRAALFYPAAGGAIGGLLLLLYFVLPDKIGVTAQATLLVGVWVWITGALHLDGLADCADALAASHKDPSRVQTVLKDPHLGTVAVCVLVMVLLLKLSLLRTALETGSFYWALLAAPVGARLLALIFMMIAPYARADGMAAQIDLRPFQPLVVGLALVGLLAVMAVMGRWAGTALVGILALWLVYWQQKWSKLIGGYTGDCVGALIEVAEVLVLLVVVLAW